MATLFRPFIELWQRLSLGQRAGLVLVVALVLAITTAAVRYTTRPVFTTLYSGLNGKDAAQVVDKLREMKVPFEVSADGSTVKVPQERVGELRLTFAGLGLPRSGEIGYELFDKPMLGMTDFVQQMNYHRALEGELARTITELEAVEAARVHLVVPAPHLFREDRKPPTASIVLQLSPGAVLTPQQVQSIAYLTAFSVEGLTVDNITIVDTRGTLLSGRTARDDMVGLSATQLEVQKSIESELERKALTLLENTLGPGRAQVKVTARLNWNRIERTVENYDPDRIAPLSEERQETTGGTTETNGTPGTSERSITNYQVPRTLEKIVPEVGNIERLSVSVLVDNDYRLEKGPDGTERRVVVERTPQEIEKFRALVATAIGYDRTRNDELTVVAFPFAQPEPPPVAVKPVWPALLEKVLLGLALVGLFLLIRTLITRLSRSLPALPSPPATGELSAAPQQLMLAPAAVPSTPAALASSATAAAQAIGAPTVVTEGSGGPQVIFKQKPQTIIVEEEEPNVEVLKHQELLKRTTDYIVQRPDSATQILRSWIIEESTEKHNR